MTGDVRTFTDISSSPVPLQKQPFDQPLLFTEHYDVSIRPGIVQMQLTQQQDGTFNSYGDPQGDLVIVVQGRYLQQVVSDYSLLYRHGRYTLANVSIILKTVTWHGSRDIREMCTPGAW